MKFHVRDESVDDYRFIYGLTERAFAPMEYSGGNEQDMIDALRAAGKLVISLVAEYDSKIIGHVAFSMGIAADGSAEWYALGPIAVDPEYQRQGIGTALIERGIQMMRHRDAAGCILVGDPNYYDRFGFVPFPQFAPTGHPPEYFMILPLSQKLPQTVVGFQPELD